MIYKPFTELYINLSDNTNTSFACSFASKCILIVHLGQLHKPPTCHWNSFDVDILSHFEEIFHVGEIPALRPGLFPFVKHVLTSSYVFHRINGGRSPQDHPSRQSNSLFESIYNCHLSICIAKIIIIDWCNLNCPCFLENKHYMLVYRLHIIINIFHQNLTEMQFKVY